MSLVRSGHARRIGLVSVIAWLCMSAAAHANPCVVTQDRSLTAVSVGTIEFVNQTSRALTVYWLDYAGNRIPYMSLAPGASYVQEAWVTHPWVVLDSAGDCY